MKKTLLSSIYKLRHPDVPDDKIPLSRRRTIIGQIWHTIRKWICQVWAPNCVTNVMRVNLYRLCGIKIGKHTFIGMKCYLDDLCVDKIEIGNNVIISYGVYFACHGKKQNHNRIIIKDRAYIGMRANIIAREDITIGEKTIIGACALVNKSIPDGATGVGIPVKIKQI